MSEIIIEEYRYLVGEFDKATKRILQTRPISDKKHKIDEYVKLLFSTYNNIVLFIEKNPTPELADKFSQRLQKCKAKLKACGGKLQYNFDIPTDGSLLSYVISDDSNSDFSDANADPPLSRSGSLQDLNFLIPPSLEHKANSSPELNCSFKVQNSSYVKMASTAQKCTFISMCSSIIRSNYDGNPLGLESFIDKINLIEELADVDLIPTFLRFILSKFKGKARESLPENVSSIAVIKSSLRNRIKPDNSKVVAGKIASLNAKRNFSEFAKQMEELSDAFERSLVVEGITHDKAHEMAIEQTVATCRANTKSDLVKAILASTKFVDPKDVVAKLIIEQANESNEKNVLRINANYNNNNKDRTFGNNYNRSTSRNFNNSSHSQQNPTSFNRNNNFRRNNNNNFTRNNGNDRNRNNNFNSYQSSRRFNNNEFGNNNGYRNDNSNSNQANVRALNSESHQQEVTLSEEN